MPDRITVRDSSTTLRFARNNKLPDLAATIDWCKTRRLIFFMTAEATATLTAAPIAPPRYTRANPFPARMVVNRRLSGPESEKDTRHFELDLTGWGLTFEVGDSLAVYATNDPELVEEIIHALGATSDEEVPRPKGLPTTFREALLRDYSITQPTPKFLKA